MCLYSHTLTENILLCPSTCVLITSDKRHLAKINQYYITVEMEIESGQMNLKMKMQLNYN